MGARKEKEAKEAAAKAKKEQEAREAAEKARKEQVAKVEAEKARQEKEAKEAAEKARKEKEAKEAAEKAKKEQEAKKAAAKARREQEEIDEAARAEREKVRDHFPERQRKTKEEEKISIKPADLSSRGRRGPVEEDDFVAAAEDVSFQEAPEDKDANVQDVVRHLLQEVRITVNLKTLKHHIDHIFMIRCGTMLKAGTLTFDKYVRIKNNDRRRMKDLV